MMNFFGCLLLGIYPIVSLWSINYQEVYSNELMLEFGAFLLITLIAWVSFYFLLSQKKPKVTFCTFVFLYMFVSFEHFFDSKGTIFIFLNRYFYLSYPLLLPIWISIFILIFLLIKNSSKSLIHYNNIFCLITLSLFAVPTYKLIHELNKGSEASNIVFEKKECSLGYLPNIYHIILDRYPRQDTLKELYNYDNAPFINFLKKRNFYIADQSLSNYHSTLLSIPSTISMEYLSIKPKTAQNIYQSSYSEYKQFCKSPLFPFFKEQGYKIINVSSRCGFSLYNHHADLNLNMPYFSIFLPTLINRTFIGPFFRNLIKKHKFNIFTVPFIHYQGVIQQFEQLKKIAKEQRSQPLFVFCHILSPHPPYIFNEKGLYAFFNEKNTIKSLQIKKYTDQIEGVNLYTKKTIETILDHSKNPPIILLHSDHGVNLIFKTKDLKAAKESFAILNTYHLPVIKNKAPNLYPSISPVNSWRMILNYYFQLDLPLLKDKSHIVPEPFSINFTPTQSNVINKTSYQ
ncbi:MAG: hypothetical protein ACJAZS_000169 [Alteromonas naphthalenivorans]|jgi:hypothetical protein